MLQHLPAGDAANIQLDSARSSTVYYLIQFSSVESARRWKAISSTLGEGKIELAVVRTRSHAFYYVFGPGYFVYLLVDHTSTSYCLRHVLIPRDSKAMRNIRRNKNEITLRHEPLEGLLCSVHSPIIISGYITGRWF